MTIKTRSAIRNACLALGITAAFAGAVSASSDANACGGAWIPEIEVDYRVAGMDHAEKALEQGQYVAAAGSVLRMIPHIVTSKPGRDPIMGRALRVLAVATVRSDGALAKIDKELPYEMVGSWTGKKDGERGVNLEWSVQALRSMNAHKQNDPALQTELGEALSRVPHYQDEAATLLGELAAKDLIASPEGYAALARLRSKAGDKTGSQAALQRCTAMAKSDSLCQVTGTFGGDS